MEQRTDNEYILQPGLDELRYEVAGLSDMTFDIYRLSLTATK